MNKIQSFRESYKNKVLSENENVYTNAIRNLSLMDEAWFLYLEFMPSAIKEFMKDNTSRMNRILAHAIVCGQSSIQDFLADVLNQFLYFEQIKEEEIPLSIRIKMEELMKWINI